MTLLSLLLLGQTMNLNQQPVVVKDEGTRLSSVRAFTVDCVGAGVTCTQSGTTWTITVSGGGGGSGNGVSDSVTFSGKSDVTKTVTAAWASASSVIVCNAADEEGSVEGLQVTVTSKGSGSFVVRGSVAQGRHTGALNIYCVGV